MAKLSIITINFNDLDGLRKTFESVAGQTARDFEYIVIDGGSTDGSKEFLQQHSDRITHWISEKDSGVYNAMNKGIRAANGEYLLFLNSGDFLIGPDVIGEVSKLIDHEAAIYYGNLYFSLNGVKTQLWTPPDVLSFSYFQTHSLPHPASFIKRQLFFDHFMYSEDFKIVSDWEFFLVCICKFNVPYKHLDIAVADFDNVGISSVKDSSSRIAAEKRLVIEKHFPLFADDVAKLEDADSKKFRQFRLLKKTKWKWALIKALLNLLSLGSKKQLRSHDYFKKL